MAVPHKYETVQLEDNDHSESSTEVDESVVGDDAKHWTAGTRRSRRSQTGRLASVFRSYRWMIDTVLILVSLCLLIRDQWSKQCPAPLLEIGGDYTGVRSEPCE